jgi:hypothetical protein
MDAYRKKEPISPGLAYSIGLTATADQLQADKAPIS